MTLFCRRYLSGLNYRASIAPVLLALFFSPLANAQSAADIGCELLVTTATEMYRAGEFSEAVTEVEPCLRSSEISRAMRQRVLRLTALAHLRADRRAASRVTVRDLLLLDPAYAGDPIFDPPDYIDFVAEVRSRELSIPIVDPASNRDHDAVATDVPPAEHDAAYAAEQPTRTFPIWVTVHMGAASYGGERGEATGSPASDFTANSGFSLGASAASPFGRFLEAGVRLQAHYLPSRFFLGFAPPTPLERSASSPWTVIALASGVVSYPAHERAIPGASLALGAAFSYLNDSVRAGVVVQPGARVEFPYDDRWSALVTAEVAVVIPGDALDLRTTSNLRQGERGFDLVSQIGAGVRYKLRP